jgi:hypothetical protein
MTSTRTNQALFQQDTITKPPMLTAGEIAPETLVALEDGALGWFAHKEIKDTDQVRLASFGFQDPRIRQWLRLNTLTFNALSFADFMVKVRATWLDRDWEHKFSNTLLNSCQGQGSFWDWQLALQTKNALLTTTPSHLPEDALCRKLASGVNAELSAALSRKDYSALSFTEWLDKVKSLDDTRLHNVSRIADEAARLNRRNDSRPASSASSRSLSRPPLSTSSTTNAPQPRRSVPKLSDDERKLLSDHEGCFKCRTFHAGHRSAECPKGFPDTSTYKPLTVALTCTAARVNTPIAAPVTVPTPLTVAAVMPNTRRIASLSIPFPTVALCA